MTNTERTDLLERVVEALSKWKSNEIKVTESIARRLSASGHDRHFSTRSTFTLVLERAVWAISGGRLMVLGVDADFCYEVAFDAVESATVEEKRVTLVERFEHQTERVSTLALHAEINWRRN